MDAIRKYSLNPFVRNYIKIFSVDVLVKGSGFLLLPVYLTLMSQDEFGLYGYLIAIISTFSLVFNLGIYASQSKLYHDYPSERRGEVLYTLNVMLLGFLMFLFVLVFLFNLDYALIAILFKNPLDYPVYRIPVLLGVVTSVYAMLLVNYFLTSENIRMVQIFNFLRALLIHTIVVTILWNVDGDSAFLRIKYSILLELGLILSFAYVYIQQMRAHFDVEVARRALSIGFPIMISAALGVFINLSDRYFIDKFGSMQDMSRYNLALTLAGIIPFVFASFQNVWLPQLMKEKNPEEGRIRNRKMVLRLTIGLLLISAGIMTFLKVLLWTGWINEKYADALPLLPIVLGTAVLASITGMYSNQLIYLEKLSAIIFVGLVVAILSVFLNLQLVPKWNIYGAAISSFIANGFFLVVYVILTARFHKQRMRTIG
ncbi:MAG: oligosaccharide flippase family protein [Cytophagales bacterium]|nr:oligosaccharide flippase family protein [Cytophagales bacterium]